MAQAATGTALETPTAELRKQVHRHAAECFVAYLAIAVAGELRHVHPRRKEGCNCPSCTGENNDHIADLIHKLEKEYALWVKSERSDAQKAVLRVLREASREKQIEFLRLAIRVFEQGNWASSFGGPAWARIAKAVFQFLSGELPPSVFVDHVFDLRHNGDRLFDKHPMVSQLTDEDRIKRQLDVKKQASSPDELYHALRRYSDFSPEVTEIWKRGKDQGAW